MPDGFETDTVFRIETNLDDCPAEVLGDVMERLLSAGALDVWFTPIQMKKHRPGVMLSVLAEERQRDALVEIVLLHTTAFGVRVEKVERVKLARRMVTVQTEFGEVGVKLGLRGEHVVQVAPEFESVRKVAAASSRPVRVIFEAAVAAWRKSAVSG